MIAKLVAIPLYGGEIAPRFCFARRMLLANIMDDAVADRRHVDVSDSSWRARLALLNNERVSLLLCGGFNRRYLTLAEGFGIFVSWGHAGPVEPLLTQLCAGTLPRPTVGCARTPGRGRGRSQGQGQGRGRRRGNR
jgi:hypothetical protein